MIARARIYSDFSSQINFEDGSRLILPPNITPLVLIKKKEKKKKVEKPLSDIMYKSTEILPSKVIQSVDCISSAVLPVFQTAVSFLNLYIPQFSFVYFSALLDRKVFAHRRKFVSDVFLFDSKYVILVEKDGSIQFGSKNGLAAVTLHADGVRVHLKYLSLVYHRENEEDKIFENKEREKSYVYTWELKFYSKFQLKAMEYLSFPLTVLEEIRKMVKEKEGGHEGITEEEFVSSIQKSESYGSSFLVEFPPNICFEDEKSKNKKRKDNPEKTLFLQYERSSDRTSKIYNRNEKKKKYEQEEEERKNRQQDPEVFTEICLGKESINLFHSTRWNSVIYYEEVDASWTKRIYPRNVFHIIHADVHKNIQILLDFLKKNNPNKRKSIRSSKTITTTSTTSSFLERREECEMNNHHGEFKCFRNGTIHISYSKDGTILEEKGGIIRLLSRSGNEQVYDCEAKYSAIPRYIFDEYRKWKNWVEMDEEDRTKEIKRTERIEELLRMSKKRIKETQKIINIYEINRIIDEKKKTD